MINHSNPILTEEYRGHTITIYEWGKSGKFYGEFGVAHVADGAAQGLHDTPEDAVNACKELIDHPYGRDDE